MNGTIHASPTDVPSYPSIDLRCSGTTAIGIFRTTTTGGQTTQTRDVYVMDDVDVGTVGTVEN